MPKVPDATSQPKNDDPLLTYQETSVLLGIPVNTLYGLIHQHRIPHIRLSGRMIRFNRSELEAWLDERRVAVRPPPRR